jgi:hypothetical protein
LTEFIYRTEVSFFSVIDGRSWKLNDCVRALPSPTTNSGPRRVG